MIRNNVIRAGAIRKTGLVSLIAVMLAVLALAPAISLAKAGEEDQQLLEPAELTLANRHIFTMRSAGLAASPAVRARTVQENLESLVQRGGPLEVTTQALPEGIAVMVDGSLVFRVLQGDADPELGDDVQLVADAAVHNLRTALAEMHELRDSGRLAKSLGYALLATLVFAGLMWALWRGYAVLARRIRGFVTRRAEQLSSGLEPSRGGPGRRDQPRDCAAAHAGVAPDPTARLRVADAGARLLPVHAALERAAARPAARRARPLRFGDARGHPWPACSCC